MKINISTGELLDKISILEIKNELIRDEEKLIPIKKELSALLEISQNLNGSKNWIRKIKVINMKLWRIEDNIRKKEKAKDFDSEFIELARSVYFINDERFKIKDMINQHYHSEFQEQKSYEDYT